MTALLNQAFDRAAQLPADQQDAIARLILDELVSETRWQQAFADSGDELSTMAKQARDAHRRGRTQPLDIDDL